MLIKQPEILIRKSYFDIYISTNENIELLMNQCTNLELTWRLISGQLWRRIQKVGGRSGVALGDFCLKDPGLRMGGAGAKGTSRVLFLRCTRALAPGAGKTFGKPGELLSPELLRDPHAEVAGKSVVSDLVNENLKINTYIVRIKLIFW